MLRRNFESRKAKRRDKADARAKAYATLSPEEKLQALGPIEQNPAVKQRVKLVEAMKAPGPQIIAA